MKGDVVLWRMRMHLREHQLDVELVCRASADKAWFYINGRVAGEREWTLPRREVRLLRGRHATLRHVLEDVPAQLASMGWLLDESET